MRKSHLYVGYGGAGIMLVGLLAVGQVHTPQQNFPPPARGRSNISMPMTDTAPAKPVPITNITPASLWTRMQQDPQLPLFDFAKSADFAAGHVPGSQPLSLEALLEGKRVSLPVRGAPVYLL